MTTIDPESCRDREREHTALVRSYHPKRSGMKFQNLSEALNAIIDQASHMSGKISASLGYPGWVVTLEGGQIQIAWQFSYDILQELLDALPELQREVMAEYVNTYEGRVKLALVLQHMVDRREARETYPPEEVPRKSLWELLTES